MKTRLWALVAIILCTACTSSAALFNKKGATLLSLSLKGTIFNIYLLIGVALLAIGSVLLMISLRGGDVSVIYPIIATSYVWVIILSYYLFGEEITSLKIFGIILIIVGVVALNLGDKKEFLSGLGIRRGYRR